MDQPLKLGVPRPGRLLALFALLTTGSFAMPQQVAASPPLSADQIMARVASMNEVRTQKLLGYTSIRTYHLESHGLVSRKADMVVRAEFRAPDTKEFTVVSESGSATIRNRVFRQLLQAELQSMTAVNQRRTELTPENYRFQLVSQPGMGNDNVYVLDVQPKIDNKFLFSGRIWVDASDFAVTRIEGKPATNPSWWTLRTDFTRQYERVGEFWFPETTRSVTRVRVFGTAVMTIDDRQYQISQPGDSTVSEVSVPPPGSP